MIYKLVSPLQVPRTKKKNFILNLNNYRNAHYFTLNATKVKYKEHMKSQIESLPVFNKIVLKYVLYPRTKHLCDLMNICSVHSKYFLDALVSFGRIEDDTYLHVTNEITEFGCIDKKNPRVEILIKEKK